MAISAAAYAIAVARATALKQRIADRAQIASVRAEMVANLTEMGESPNASDSLLTLAGLVDDITTGVDTSDASAVAADIAAGKTAYVNGVKVDGVAPPSIISVSPRGTKAASEEGYFREGPVLPQDKAAVSIEYNKFIRGTVDLTTGKTAIGCGEASGTYSKARAFDDVIGSPWWYHGGNEEHWIGIDLGAGNAKCVGKLVIHGYNGGFSVNFGSFHFQGSDDATTWNTVYSGNHSDSGSAQTYQWFPAPVTPYRYWRVICASVHAEVDIYEIEMFEYSEIA